MGTCPENMSISSEWSILVDNLKTDPRQGEQLKCRLGWLDKSFI